MKSFKEFTKSSRAKPVIITALPSHGSHTLEKTIKESQSTSDWTDNDDESDHANKHLGPNPDTVHEHMSNKYSLKGDNQHLMDEYLVDSTKINKHLIHGESTPQTTKQIRNIDKAMSSTPPLDHDLHVYHGTKNWHPGKESAKHPEGHVKLPGYTSTSIVRHIAQGFSHVHRPIPSKHGSHVLHIQLKKGQHGVYTGHHEENPDSEYEYTLPRNTTLKIKPKPTKLQHKNGNTLHIWHAHVVGE